MNFSTCAKGLVMGVVLLSAAGAMAASGDMVPVNLRCEYLVNPLGIDATAPRLSWELKAVDKSARGLEQSAYQILVVTSGNNLAADTGDLWDTGKVTSSDSNQIVYTGKPLTACRLVVWKVRVWDAQDQVSDWSAPALWSMGLLQKEDWKGAQWIGDAAEAPAEKDNPNPPIPPSPLLRRAFVVDGPVMRATLYVTSRGDYECRLNGVKVSDRMLSPEWTDYEKRIQYQVYDVRESVHEGDNVLGAMLGDGWYLGRLGPTRWNKDYPRRGVYGLHRRLLARLDVELADGTVQSIVTDGDWKCNPDGPIRQVDNFLGETFDARKIVPGWDAPGFDDASWAAVTTEPLDDVLLEAQMNEPIRVIRELPAQSVAEPTPNVYIFDLGQNMPGWCRIRIQGEAGQEIMVRHGEMLNPDGTLYTENLAAAVQEDRYILAGTGEEVFEPHFTYHGFRYVEVTGLKAKPETGMVTGCVVCSDTRRTGTLECSNPMLNKLVENVLWTQRSNMHSVPTDCPQRDERMGWMGDAQVFGQSAIFNTDMAAFFTKWMQDIRDAQAKDGSFPDIAPHAYDPDVRFKNAPGWADAGVVVPWRLYQNYGDTRVLREQLEAAKRYIECIHRDNPDLLWKNNVGNNYGDWLNGDTIKAEGYPKHGGQLDKVIFATAFFAYSTGLVADMCEVLGEVDDAARYRELAAQIIAIFNKEFVNDEGKIKGDTQAGYAMALHFNLLSEALRPKAVAHMVRAIEKYDGRMSTGFHSTYRMMLELSRWGHNDLAYQLVESTRFPSWGYSIEQGATTIWERWDGYVKGRGFQDPGMNSFNHYAIGAVVEWMYRTIAGINLDEANPGYSHFVIHPQPGGTLTWAKGSYDSIRGLIKSAWKLENDKFTLDIQVPPNTEATVYVPATSADTVLESGKPAADAPGVAFVRMENDAAVYHVKSGCYSFSAG